MANAKPDLDSDAAERHPTDAEAAATSAMFVFTADKAGMKGVDKQHVQAVVHKMSKDSSFYQKSLRDNEKVEQRVAAMRDNISCLTDGHLARLQQQADDRVRQMEATRGLTRTIVVVDMDMFFAAVEMRDNPKLRDVPLAVGGLNMISTTNYVARQFGVRAAMPGFIGKALCPDLHFVPVNMEKYKAVAAQTRTVFAQYDPDFEAFSVDEACLDITEYMTKNWHKYASTAADEAERKEDDEEQWASSASGRAVIAAAVVRELRQRIFDCTQLTASAGIAANSMLAKICSDMNKPNGQFVLPFTRDDVMTFIRKLPVRKIGGIGKVTEKILSDALNVHTGGDLFDQRGKIFHLFSEKTAVWLLQTSLAVRPRREKQERKSFSRERTFRSLSEPELLEAKCLEICTMLAIDLAKANQAAKNVAFVFKDTGFARSSRSVSLASAVFTADDLYANAVELLRRELPLTLRLMGVRASSLVSRSTEEKSSDASQADEGLAASKKRQLVIKKFAEVTDPVATLSSDDQHRTAPSTKESSAESNAAMNHYFAALVQANAEKSECLPCPSCGRTLRASADNGPSDVHEFGCTIGYKLSLSRKRVETEAPRAFATIAGAKSALEVDNKPCPICGKLLNARNNMEVNAHMDACVVRKKPSPSSSPLRHTSRKKPRTMGMGISLAFAAVQDSEKPGEDTKPCPICGKLLNAKKSMEVNAHMDACVTRDRSSPSRRPAGKQRIEKAALKRKHENSIDVFFRKN